ncbi:MAG TPA: ATP-binding protein [Acidobacteriota bacterium]|jgi:anti-sigma regulatory factor (Ser/Thr protein kinase)
MTERVSVALKNQLPEIQRLSEILDQFGKRNGVSPAALFHMQLALDEILTNVISYGYRDDREHQIFVRLSLHEGELTAEVEDDGQPYNPLSRPDPDISRPLEEKPIGGLGIYLTRHLLDGLQYRTENGWNLLVMKKKARAADGESGAG